MVMVFGQIPQTQVRRHILQLRQQVLGRLDLAARFILNVNK
jgi:hypothetical protein